MIAVIDYGVGNMFSLLCSLKAVGAQGVLTFDETEIKNAEKIILPGVGAFADARLRLYQTGLSSVVQEEALNGKPLLGVCLGMQLLFEKSFENGEYEGLGLIPGEVVSFKGAIDSKLKIPQIGWNSLIFSKNREKSRLYKYTDEGAYVYFVHSYYASSCDDFVSAYTQYGINITASAEKGSIYAVQYHPEKSGKTGLKILQAFCEI